MTAQPATANAPAVQQPQQPQQQQSLVVKFANRFGVEPNRMMATLKATAFRPKAGDPEPSNEQMMALLIVADQYGLNPWTKEIYAFPDKQNGIVPVVGVDGWARIINEQSQCDGIEFRQAEQIVRPDGGKDCPAWIECVIYRKDRDHATVVREYIDEVYRAPYRGTSRDGKEYQKDGPWQSHTKRMLRHKALIQSARLAFGFVGIYDDDEAQRIIEGSSSVVAQPTTSAAIAALNSEVTGSQTFDGESTREQHAEGDGEQAGDQAKAPATETNAATDATGDTAKPAAETTAAPTFTFAEVSAKINAATNTDDLNAAVDLIKHVPDPAHQKELRTAAKEKAKGLAKA